MRLTPIEQSVESAGIDRDAVAASDRERRKAHGIVHTPPALARAMAQHVDVVLRDELGMRHGLADPKIALLDPACGPGAFLAAAFAVAGARSRAPGRVIGLDLDGGALAQARAGLEAPLAGRGWPLELREVDTLAEDPEAFSRGGPSTLVVLGNPPWAGKSQSRGGEQLLEDFRRDPTGERLAERKIGVLSDDYVRFFRWSAEAVRRAPGGGVLALITNGSFLDGPVHRGMRAALARWFEGIDVFDLGGSALVARTKERDDNVFGVRPAVAITIAYRPRRHGELVEGGRVRYVRIRGTREEKLEALAGPHAFVPVRPTASGYVFRPIAATKRTAEHVGLHEAMPMHREGVQTNRDRAVIAKDAPTLLARLRAFVDCTPDDDLAAACVASAHYSPDEARAAVAFALERDSDGSAGLAVRALAFRPFDTRVFAPIGGFCHRARPDLALALARSAFALVSVRKDRGERAWAHFGLVRDVPDNCFLSNRSSCRTRAFPTHDPNGAPNLDAAVAAAFSERSARVVDVIGFAHYALAVLASETYRARHDDALRLDYPTIPIPASPDAYEALEAAGAALREVFLAPPGDETTTLGYYVVSNAPTGYANALARCDEAYRRAFPG